MADYDGVRGDDARAQKIACLNDACRRGQASGRLLVTPGIIRLARATCDDLLAAVRKFDSFDADNDRHGERDFGALDWQGERVFWKIDYYDISLECGSPDPADAAVTTRVLTIMLASEY